MLNDFTAYVYLTNDYGQTWEAHRDAPMASPVGDYTRRRP